ncbi:MAG: Uncharacterized protein FD148_2780, partial [Methylocystaceae bacterium]
LRAQQSRVLKQEEEQRRVDQENAARINGELAQPLSARCSLASLLCQLSIPFLREVQIYLAGLLRLLLKVMQHVNGIGESGDIDNAERAVRLSNANLSNTSPDRRRRLPIVGLSATLQRKGAQIVEGAPRNSTGIGVLIGRNMYCISRQPGPIAPRGIPRLEARQCACCARRS